MPDTINRSKLVLDLLAALDWTHAGRVHSVTPDHADIRLKRAELDDKCVTGRVLRMQAAGFVEPFGTLWRLTPQGRAMRNSIRKYAGSA